MLTFCALSIIFMLAAIATAKNAEGLPWGICYSALLSVSIVGLLRVGKSAFIVLGGASIVAFAPAILGLTFYFDTDAGWKFVRLSTYLLWAVGLVGAAFVAKGWRLYAIGANP
jgi:hypothetical protein